MPRKALAFTVVLLLRHLIPGKGFYPSEQEPDHKRGEGRA
jgi:hypothetical protein